MSFTQAGISPQRTNIDRRSGWFDPGACGKPAIAIRTGCVGASVVAGRKILQLRQTEKSGSLVRRGGQGKAFAHELNSLKWSNAKVAMELALRNR